MNHMHIIGAAGLFAVAALAAVRSLSASIEILAAAVIMGIMP